VPPGGQLPPSQQVVADRLVNLWRETGAGTAVQLFGNDETARRAVPAAACAMFGVPLYSVRAGEMPVSPSEREAYVRLWQRETLLSGCVLLIDCDRADCAEMVRPFIERNRGVLVLAAAEPLRDACQPLVKIEVRKPSAAEQDAIWRTALGPLAEKLNGQLRQVTSVGQRRIQSPLSVERNRAARRPMGNLPQSVALRPTGIGPTR